MILFLLFLLFILFFFKGNCNWLPHINDVIVYLGLCVHLWLLTVDLLILLGDHHIMFVVLYTHIKVVCNHTFSFLKNYFKHLFSLVIAIFCCVHCIEGLSNFYCCVLHATYELCVSLYWRLSNLLHYPFELNGMSHRVNYALSHTDRTKSPSKKERSRQYSRVKMDWPLGRETETCYTHET